MPFDLSQEEGEFLICLARKAVEEYLTKKRHVAIPLNTSKKLMELGGVFVTLNTVKERGKELRGCIGYPYPMMPIVQAVIDSAINAATQDPRFLPLDINELDKVAFEISVLTTPQRIEVNNPKEYRALINIGQDGLIVERGICKGLLLPQVPVEWKWNEEEFLCQCCEKAGLPADYWLVEGTKVSKFQAIIFEEMKPHGKIRRVTLSEK